MNAPKPAKPLKDVDSRHQALFLNNFCKIFPLIGLAGFLLGGLYGLMIAFSTCTLVAFFVVGLSGQISESAVNVFYGMRRGNWSLRERLAGDLSCARVQKMNYCFDEALGRVEGILAQDPDHPEALFLKAQILWEGYQDGAGAKGYLIQAVKAEPNPNSSIQRWARILYKEVLQAQAGSQG